MTAYGKRRADASGTVNVHNCHPHPTHTIVDWLT